MTSVHSSNSPHLVNKSMTNSPRQRNTLRSGTDHSKDPSPAIQRETSVPTVNPPEQSNDNAVPTTNAPLAPPPRPTQNANNQQDYFQGEHLSKEPNPFESAFGGGSSETPGKALLPGVTSLTSPASLLPGITPGWPGSLRSGPLSPAMLAGPTGSNDYFNSEHHFNGSFPTPNESSLRSGLTPGGGGSMFPQPSPNTQSMYNQLQNGGATPGTLDFHRTALNARAQTHANSYNMATNGTTSQPQQNPNIQPDLDAKPFSNQHNLARNADNQDPFSSHQTNDAVNGLFMLAQAGGQQRNGQQAFAMPQSSHQGYQQSMQQDHKRGGNKDSIGSNISGSTEPGQGEYSDASVEQKPSTRGRGRKGNGPGKAAGSKRKTDETVKGGNKKQRGSAGQAMSMDEPDDEDEQMPDDMDENGPDGKKMTDEEKRKNFLERNRVAALKCRQRKKQWLANLQQKVELFSQENDGLAATVTQLREEIVGLKTLLLAHKDCPVSQAQGISGMAMQQIAGDAHQQYANPYGMAMGSNGPGSVSQQSQMGQSNLQRS